MLLTKLTKLKKEGKKIGFTASTFDFLHAGHVLMLEESKNNCDFLIVGLLTDPTISRPAKNKPVQTTLERWIQAQSISYIDLLIPFDTEEDLYDLISIVQPDIRFVGEEYKNQDFNGKKYCEENSIEIFYNRRQHSFSSTKIQNALKQK